ncbi:hypothetical protein MTR67_051744 [Solanum verrucosum]|uniref:Uncharacterized protein n=1 Tax=Solanum verrucosum TaxID=315347 RepID=A0AAF0V6U0_SOLVR|nr:hypothetical protein MTR67_051744 [Solanum verrucosum]
MTSSSVVNDACSNITQLNGLGSSRKGVVARINRKDHSTQLVGIADTLGDLPFGLVHRLLALASSRFDSLGDKELLCRTPRRCADCFLSNTDLIFSFRAQHIGTLGEVKAIQRLA